MYSKNWELFNRACADNDIDVINSSNDFISYYSEYCEVPYGFFNTKLGYGHLNEAGHAIIANEILEYLGDMK